MTQFEQAFIHLSDATRRDCLLTSDNDSVLDARRLMAREYVRRKFITSDQLNENGVVGNEDDPYHNDAKYFVLRNDEGACVATLRTLHYSPEKDRESFPVLKYESVLYPEFRDEIYEIGLENIIEVSALVRDKDLDTEGTAAIELYKKLFLDSWSDFGGKDKCLIMACNPVLFDMFKVLFDGSMMRIGPDLPYPGQEAVPTMFKLNEGAINLIECSRRADNNYRTVHQKVVEYFLAGTQASSFHPDIMEALERNDYQDLARKMRENNWPSGIQTAAEFQRSMKKAVILCEAKERTKRYRPELLSGIGLAGYSLARAAAVAKGLEPVSDVEWKTLLGIELLTTPQYVWGVGDLVRNADNSSYSRKRKIGAYTAAVTAYAAPYGYMLSNGALSSAQGVGVVAGIAGVAAIPAATRKIRKRWMEKNKNKTARA